MPWKKTGLLKQSTALKSLSVVLLKETLLAGRSFSLMMYWMLPILPKVSAKVRTESTAIAKVRNKLQQVVLCDPSNKLMRTAKGSKYLISEDIAAPNLDRHPFNLGL